MIRNRTSAALGALALLAAPAAALAGTTSHASFWSQKTGSAVCGFKVGSTKLILCAAHGIPRPKGVKGGDAGFVQISAHGKPQTIVTFQDEFPAGIPTTLPKGSTWFGRGVTCNVAAKTVTCTNKSSHGFTIGNGKYKHF